MTRYNTNTWSSDVEVIDPRETMRPITPSLGRAASVMSVSSSWKNTPGFHGFGGTIRAKPETKHARGYTYTFRGYTKHGHGSTMYSPTELKYGYGGIYDIRRGPSSQRISDHLTESAAILRYHFNQQRENRLHDFPEPFPQIEETSPFKSGDNDDTGGAQQIKLQRIVAPDELMEPDQKIPDFKQSRYRSQLVRGVYPNSLSVDEMDQGVDPSGLMTRVDPDEDFDDMEFELQNFDNEYDDAGDRLTATTHRTDDPQFKHVPYQSKLVRGVYPNSAGMDDRDSDIDK